MVSPLPTAVVIECPHCGTRYQLPPEAIGPKGRKVACAHCGETWQAHAEMHSTARNPDAMFDEVAERELDDAFAAEERDANPPPPDTTSDDKMRSIAAIRAAIAPKPKPPTEPVTGDAEGDRRRQKDFTKRQVALSRQSPLAKTRRLVRVAGFSVLVLLIGCGVTFRTEIVRQYPDLAGAYDALGLGVNVVGLEFRDVTTLVMLKSGSTVMQVDARIYSVAAQTAEVPPVVVTLLDENAVPLYEWSVTPNARQLEPGEVVDFTTQLNSPPPSAKSVRLTFNDGNARAESSVGNAATTSQ